MDRNICEADMSIGVDGGRSLRGNVDRNPAYESTEVSARVVPYVGTWIEITRSTPYSCCIFSVVPYVGTWIEIPVA